MLVAIIGKSDFIAPYQTQRALPVSSTININGDTSAAFLVLTAVIICGKLAADVQMPATNPNSWVVSIEFFLPRPNTEC